MSNRSIQAPVAAFCFALFALTGCQATGDPPVAEWSIDPPRPRGAAPGSSSGKGASAGLTRSDAKGALVVQGTGRLIGSSRASNGDQDESDEGDVTLNLVNLPVAQAAKVVLGDILGANYVVDPKLDAKITVHTAHPIQKTKALELFSSALRTSGATVVRSGGIYKVVALDQAATAGGDISSGPLDRKSPEFGEGKRVVQLRYVSASEMKRVLEPIAVQGGVLRADDARHTLTLSASPQELAALEDVVSMFDVDTMRGMSFALIPVKSSDPDALAENLRQIFGTEDKDGPMNGMVRFIGNKRLAAILAISSQSQYLERARAWVQKLDARAQGTEKQFFTYRVQNRPAKELAQVLASMFGADGAGRAPSNVAPRFGLASFSSGNASDASPQGAAPTSPLGALSAAGPVGSPGGQGGLGGSMSPLSSPAGSAGPAATGAGAAPPNDPQSSKGPQAVALGEDGRLRVGVDEAKNALVVMATADDYKRLLQMVEKLDVLPNQVFIEATIAEVSLTDDLQFGVKWFLQKGWHGAGFSTGPASQGPQVYPDWLGSNFLGADLSSVFPGFSYAMRANNAMVTLNALNQITKVNILSTPSLTVLDNRQAVLQVGDQIPITTLSNFSALGTTTNSQQYLDTGVILAITPHISESGRLMLELQQEVSNPAPGTPSVPGGNPTIQQRKVKTDVVVSDGESLVLGGLIQDSRTNTTSQIPVLGDLPVVGIAFKDKDDSIGKTELLIMITPHVVRSVSEAREIADEYKRKLLQISTKAIARPHDIEQSARRAVLDDTSVSPWALDRASH